MKVFTPNEIARKKVPSRESFREALAVLRECVEKNSDIIGAWLYGSLAYSCVNETSDMDVVMVVIPTPRIKKVLEECFYEIHKMHVPTNNINMLEVQYAQKGLHTLGPGLLESIRRAQKNCGGSMRGNIDEIIKPREMSLKQEARDYMTRKVRKIIDNQYHWGTLSVRDRCEATARVLDAPFHVVRKILGAHDCAFMQGDGKREVLREYKQSARAVPRNIDILRETMEAQKYYRDMLTKAIHHQLPDPYERVVEQLFTTQSERAVRLIEILLTGKNSW